MSSTSMIPWALNFKGLRTGEHGVLEVASQVQLPPIATLVHVDPMDIVQAAPNHPNAHPINVISGDTEQVTAQNPPYPTPEIREVGTKAIRFIQHLTSIVERSDALNKRN